MDAVLEAIAILATFENVGLLLAGTAVGIFIGAMPGLSVNMGTCFAVPDNFQCRRYERYRDAARHLLRCNLRRLNYGYIAAYAGNSGIGGYYA